MATGLNRFVEQLRRTLAPPNGGDLTDGQLLARFLASRDELTEGVMKAMLLTKLKVAGWVLLLAVCVGSGAAYRATAREAADGPQATRSLENELEALRLEVEALRKGLQSTGERVKVLETQVEELRPRGGAGAARGGMGMPGAGPGGRAMMMGRMGGGRPGMPGGPPGGRAMMPGMPGLPAPMGFPAKPGGSDRVPKARPRDAADPLADAEAALKQLRQNPNDKQAAEALEQALRQFKEQGKPKKK